MNPREMIRKLTDRWKHIKIQIHGRDIYICYNHEDLFPNGKVIAMIQPHYQSHPADEEPYMGAYKLSFGLENNTFGKLFGDSSHPAWDEDAKTNPLHDILLPNFKHIKERWVEIIDPSEAHFDRLMTFLDESYEIAKRKFEYQLKRKTAMW